MGHFRPAGQLVASPPAVAIATEKSVVIQATILLLPPVRWQYTVQQPRNVYCHRSMVTLNINMVTLKVYIQNLKGSVRELTHKGLKDAQLILDHLQEVLQEDNSARGGVVVDEAHTLEVLYFLDGT